MKLTNQKRFRQSALIKPVACLTLALSALMSGHSASATTVTLPAPDGGVVWCNGDGTAGYPAIPNFPADTAPGGVANPLDTWDAWQANPVLTNPPMGLTAETVAPAGTMNTNDRYAIQLNYWNSTANSTSANPNAPFGYSAGHACMLFYYNTGNVGQFTITYPATPSTPNQAEIDWHKLHPNDYPTFVPFADFDSNNNYVGVNPTKGGPTGYVSSFKGCSWDSNSCTTGSKVPDTGVTPTRSTDDNVFPEKFSDVTSIPTQWNISFNHTYGTPEVLDKTAHVWDASYDIWFDTTAQTGHGVAPYGDARGQNDGLEIMVWLNSNGSYVDSGVAGAFPKEDQPGLAQPTGHIRERVWINGVFYDVWVGRLNNPYFAPPGGTVVTPLQSPHDCPTLAVNGGNGTLCGTSWNVVSFVATKDLTPTDYRGTSMSMDAKVFADYILGIPDGLWVSYADTVPNTAKRADYEVLKCPASNMNQALDAPTIDCLNSNWYLTSVQAGFEPWIGGNGLQSDFFKAHVITKGEGVQTGLVNDQGQTIIHWGTPFEVVYSDCPKNSGSTVSFNIEGTNSIDGSALYYPGTPGANPPALGPTSGIYQVMNGPDPVTGQYTYQVPALYPMHGLTTIHFVSPCGTYDTTVFIDPSGKVFYSDGKTPIAGANVTLLRSTSGSPFGPFSPVPNHNIGLSTPVMQPDDNTQNSMLSTSIGSYAWNVIPGWYRVSAQLAGCGSVTTSSQQVTATHAIENLNITLPCAAPAKLNAPPAGGGGSNGVKVQLTVNGADWQNGYCRNVVLTNTTSKPITWKVNFNLPFPGNITQAWNMNYTKSGNVVTAQGAGWNNVIQPGQVLKDQGFCATK